MMVYVIHLLLTKTKYTAEYSDVTECANIPVSQNNLPVSQNMIDFRCLRIEIVNSV